MVPYTYDLPREGDILFFTEEKTLLAYQANKQYHFYPRNQYDWDDKLVFSQILRNMGESPVPNFDLNTCEFEFPIYLKAKRSWYQDINMPRGFLCYSSFEVSETLFLMKKKGFNSDLFFLQKFIQNGTKNTFSVCGFFDYRQKERNFSIILRKVLGTQKQFATSVIVESVEDPERLMDRANKILSYFCYIGPFELEFIFDQWCNQYYVLELNPRFWMQHGIFIDFFDNYLIKCYLNLDTEEDRRRIYNGCYKKIYWVHLDVLNFLKMPLFYGKTILIILYYCFKRKAKACFYPNFLTCMWYSFAKIFKKVKNILRKALNSGYKLGD